MLLIRHASRYMFFGGMLTLVGYASIVLLTHVFGISPYLANAGVYIAGILASYWLNARLVFADSIRATSFIKFLISFLIAYFANLFVLAVGLDWLHLNLWQAQFVATAVYAVVHFFLSRKFVFLGQSRI